MESRHQQLTRNTVQTGNTAVFSFRVRFTESRQVRIHNLSFPLCVFQYVFPEINFLAVLLCII